jgi:FixJ family two-component response regulator
MQAGAAAFLGKPFNDEQLLQTIRSALRGEFGVTKNLISVVDDDESVRRTTTLLIESFGFRAATFESAESFLRSGQLHDTSCLIVDVQMPGMNGLQLQSHLAAAGCGIPIIFITAYDDRESRQRAMQAGAVAFLGKPFSDEHLLQTICSALRQDKGGTKATRL